jgi:mono/diheme cytochrome c family protein
VSGIRLGFYAGVLSALSIVVVLSCTTARHKPIPPEWKETEVDVFPGMDGVTLDPSKPDQKEALRGRIVWNLWVGDSGLMWDYLARNGFGTADLLKTVDSRRRGTRFQEIGIINQPGFMQAAKPDQYGLFLDVPNPNDPDGKFDDKVDYATYGRSSGVIGLRISNNPDFNDAAKTEWMKHVGPDGVNHDFYENPAYYNNKNLVRPYIVGMSCALCHVSFDPVRPPADVNNPKWSNLNDYVGAQYFSVVEFFVPRLVTGGVGGQPVAVAPREEDSFVWQLINSSPRGSLDTSFIATDYLNNPGTMNGVFNVPQRLTRAAAMVSTPSTGPQVEQLTGGALDLKWLNVDKGGLVPRVLKQGDDSVGFEGALSRVYVNIGHAWPEWQKHFRPLVGGPLLRNGFASQSPVTVKGLQQNSAYWNWSEDRSHALAVYFINYAKPRLLRDAPGGAAYINDALVPRGKEVFAENCAACHSSKQPPDYPFDNEGRVTDAAKNWFRQAVQQPDFFTDNFLSDERRHPVTQIRTNSTRAAATNATRGHIWDNFSSETYKQLPAIKPFEVDNPWAPNGKSTVNIPLPGEDNGPGYYRPPSLISLWSSAPFLHNNTVGVDPLQLHPNDVSVAARIDAFNDGIRKMLWMEPRGNLIWKTTKKSFINIPQAYLPDFVNDIVKKRHPELIDEAKHAVLLGPIPEGTPINLIANTNLDPGLKLAKQRLDLVTSIIDTFARAKNENMNDDQVRELMRTELVPRFLALNKDPDFIEDKGHFFGRTLSNDDKLALIELLKTF